MTISCGCGNVSSHEQKRECTKIYQNQYVPKALVEHQAHEDVSMHHVTSESVVQRLRAVIAVPTSPANITYIQQLRVKKYENISQKLSERVPQLLPYIINNFPLLMKLERSGVLEYAVHGAGLTRHRLNQHPCSHA